MQTALRKLSFADLQDRYEVTRSNEIGSMGLFTLQKKPAAVTSGIKRPRPLSLRLTRSTDGNEGSGSLKSGRLSSSIWGYVGGSHD